MSFQVWISQKQDLSDPWFFWCWHGAKINTEKMHYFLSRLVYWNQFKTIKQVLAQIFNAQSPLFFKFCCESKQYVLLLIWSANFKHFMCAKIKRPRIWTKKLNWLGLAVEWEGGGLNGHSMSCMACVQLDAKIPLLSVF